MGSSGTRDVIGGLFRAEDGVGASVVATTSACCGLH